MRKGMRSLDMCRLSAERLMKSRRLHSAGSNQENDAERSVADRPRQCIGRAQVSYSLTLHRHASPDCGSMQTANGDPQSSHRIVRHTTVAITLTLPISLWATVTFTRHERDGASTIAMAALMIAACIGWRVR